MRRHAREQLLRNVWDSSSEWQDPATVTEHVRRVRKARGASPPPSLETDPLVYQGGSGVLLGPRDDGYEQARRVHNGLVDKRPALIAGCSPPGGSVGLGCGELPETSTGMVPKWSR